MNETEPQQYVIPLSQGLAHNKYTIKSFNCERPKSYKITYDYNKLINTCELYAFSYHFQHYLSLARNTMYLCFSWKNTLRFAHHILIIYIILGVCFIYFLLLCVICQLLQVTRPFCRSLLHSIETLATNRYSNLFLHYFTLQLSIILRNHDK